MDNSSENSNQELKSSLNFTKTKTDQFSVFIISIFGSMYFLTLCLVFFAIWIACNINLISFIKPFDLFPFPVLDMGVSLFTFMLSVIVLINQNRQGRIESIKHQVEFEVNVRAENEITKALTLLHEIHQKMGLDSKNDNELEEMKEQIDLNQIHQALDEKAPSDSKIV